MPAASYSTTATSRCLSRKAKRYWSSSMGSRGGSATAWLPRRRSRGCIWSTASSPASSGRSSTRPSPPVADGTAHRPRQASAGAGKPCNVPGHERHQRLCVLRAEGRSQGVRPLHDDTRVAKTPCSSRESVCRPEVYEATRPFCVGSVFEDMRFGPTNRWVRVFSTGPFYEDSTQERLVTKTPNRLSGTIIFSASTRTSVCSD